MRRTLLPYRNAGSILHLEPLRMVDSRTGKGVTELEWPLDLGSSDWRTAVLDLRVIAAGGSILTKCLVKGETVQDHITMVLRVAAKSTRYRALQRLEPNADGVWTGTLSFDRSLVRGRVTLEAMAVRSKPGVVKAGYAYEKGSRLAWSDAKELIVDYAPPSGSHLEVRFEHFGDHPALKTRKDSIYYLDISEDLPVLWINKDIYGLQRILNSRGFRGDGPAVRDALDHSIAQAVWMELVVAAAGHGGLDDMFHEWRRAVLLRAARAIFPSDADEDAVTKLVRTLKLPDEIGMDVDRDAIVSDLSTAIQRLVPLQQSTRKLLDTLDQ